MINQQQTTPHWHNFLSTKYFNIPLFKYYLVYEMNWYQWGTLLTKSILSMYSDIHD